MSAAAPVATPLPSAAAIAAAPPNAAVIATALVGGLVAIALLAALMRRNEELVPLLAIAAMPFRLPISTGGRTVNLLIPLYLVVAAGTLAYLLPRLPTTVGRLAARVAPPSGRARAAADEGPAARGLSERLLSVGERWLSVEGVQTLLVVAVVLYALQGAYSPNRSKAAENVAFFYVPFALLFALLREVRWTRALLLRCLALAAALAVVFAGVGFIEYARKSLFLNPKVVAANQYDNYFRVNSLFFDPNIYGRFLALVMVALTAIVLWSARRREIMVAAAALLWLLGGLITSFSQSSIAALLLGLALLAAWRWSVRGTIYASLALLALGGALVLLAPASLHFGLKGSGGSTSNATSGRTKLISGGLELFAARPLYGYGSGSFEMEYKRHGHASAESATSASHTIPITVAAEQGIVGLAVYVALLLAALTVLFRGAGRSPPRLALAACFAALVLHTWTYADFLEDPFTWALLAIGLALAGAAQESPSATVPAASRLAVAGAGAAGQ